MSIEQLRYLVTYVVTNSTAEQQSRVVEQVISSPSTPQLLEAFEQIAKAEPELAKAKHLDITVRPEANELTLHSYNLDRTRIKELMQHFLKRQILTATKFENNFSFTIDDNPFNSKRTVRPTTLELTTEQAGEFEEAMQYVRNQAMKKARKGASPEEIKQFLEEQGYEVEIRE